MNARACCLCMDSPPVGLLLLIVYFVRLSMIAF